MSEPHIKCPHCGKPVEITQAVTHEVEHRLRDEFNAKFKTEIAKREEKLRKEAEEKAVSELNVRLADLEFQLQQQKKKSADAEAKEIEFLKKQRELEERERTGKLEMERQLHQQTTKIRDEVERKVGESFKLKEAEREKLVSDLKKQIDEMKRKAEQGSQQTQGEVLELELEEVLKSKFRYDDIIPVSKGVKGADVIQQVKLQNGSFAGTIIWESKRTKAWSDGWIQKLKDDQRQVNASIAVIVSVVLPKEMTHIGNIDGVWVTDFDSSYELAAVLRSGLIELANAKNALTGKGEKMELLYSYLLGQDFKNRVEAIVESFMAMKNDLEAEKRSMERIWSKREKQIERVSKSIHGMRGDLEGLMGKELPPVSVYELPLDGTAS